MLTIGVHLHHRLVAAFGRKAEPAPQSGPYAKIERVLDHLRPVRSGHHRGAIRGPVIDHQHVATEVGEHGRDDGPDRCLLVQRRDHDECG